MGAVSKRSIDKRVRLPTCYRGRCANSAWPHLSFNRAESNLQLVTDFYPICEKLDKRVHVPRFENLPENFQTSFSLRRPGLCMLHEAWKLYINAILQAGEKLHVQLEGSRLLLHNRQNDGCSLSQGHVSKQFPVCFVQSHSALWMGQMTELASISIGAAPFREIVAAPGAHTWMANTSRIAGLALGRSIFRISC